MAVLLYRIWDLAASRSWSAAKTYAKIVALSHGGIVILGLVQFLMAEHAQATAEILDAPLGD
jgi:hypothetical protein